MTIIKIRYRDQRELSPGLHAAAERHGHVTTVYLLSGLSATQRRAALRRLRISARRGYGPCLPAPQLALALLADRIRTTAGRAGAIFRSHPAGSTVPVMVVSAGAIAFLALSAVVVHRPSGLGPPSFGAAVAAGPSASGYPGPGPAGSRGPVAAGRNDPGDRTGPAAGAPGRPGSGSSPGDPAPAASGSGGGTAGDPGGGETATPGGAAPTPTPGGDPADPTTAADSSPAASSSAAAPSAGPTPSATPSASKSGRCVMMGPLGICL